MVNRIEVLKTLLYFNIFNFPLTKDEIWDFLGVKESREIFLSRLSILKIPQYKSHFYYKNKINVDKRIAKRKVNALKLKKAINVIEKLSFIPTIKFIGISGSLAMQNSETKDDIDLFVITSANLTWLTRLLCIGVLVSLGVYRNSKDRKVSNKICLNYLISENALRFNKDAHNLYLAHEITQMLPVLDVNNTYQKFINENKWIYNFLPNILQRINNYEIFFKRNKGVLWEKVINFLIFTNLEKIARYVQWQYMKRKITREKVTNKILAFHPVDYEKKILNEFEQLIEGLK